MKIPVWVLTIQHKHGANVTVHSTDVDANVVVDLWVCNEWSSVMGDEPMPENPDQRIDAYFEHAGGRADEYFSIDQTELELPMPLHLEHDDCKIDLQIFDCGVVGVMLRREAHGIKESGAAYSYPITEERARKSKERSTEHFAAIRRRGASVR